MIRSPEIFKVLQTAPLFQGVQARLLVEKLSESRLRTLNAGEALLVAGQANNVVYVILSGRLSIQSKESGVESIALLGEGECVGEESLIGDVHISAYVMAVTNCKLLAIEHAALWELIESSHQAAHNMLRVLSMRIRPAAQIMTESNEDHQGFSGSPIVDEMTGLYNRQWIEDKISRYLQRHVFDKRPNCLMMVEIDRFKEVDDKYGQLGSEQVLRDTVRAMLSCLRPGDQAAHFLGEQFAVFMPHTDLADGCIAAERLRAAINESVIVLPSGDALPPISVSLGVSMASADDTPGSLFARAHEALQQATASGGNCVTWWSNALGRGTAQVPEKQVSENQVSGNRDTSLPITPFMALWSGTQPEENLK
ncbi:MAG: GGDEF domain-containing protein [Gallionella sp.]|nr:GGDEF domain-containing protein [Gallionella sp.]